MADQSNQTVLTQGGLREDLIFHRMMSSPMAVIDSLSPAANKFVYSRASQVLIDSILVTLALFSAYLIRFDGWVPQAYLRQMLLVWPFDVMLYLSIYSAMGGYNRIWRFFGLKDALVIARTVTAVLAVSVLVWSSFASWINADMMMPFGVILIHPFLSHAVLVSARLARRTLYDRAGRRAMTSTAARKRSLLVGAGEAGVNLLHELRDSDFEVVGFLDDESSLKGRTIGGWQVLGATSDLDAIVRSHRVDEVVLCIPSAPKAVRQRIVAACENVPVAVKSVPTLAEIMAGDVALGRLRPVKMEDLLGRDSVAHTDDLEELRRVYSGRRILVTGAGGSIGSELVRQLRRFRPSALILLDKDENNLYEVSCEIKEDFEDVVEVIADVRNGEVIQQLFALHKPDVVFHAAAYKHVPLMERHPSEAILNNVMGTRQVAEASHRCGVKIFVLISTDKAVNPSSMMGASKRVAEMIVQQLASTGSSTRFCCVRFGNVLGSRASVVPIFQRQINQGRNITVTHPEVSRYFMTIPEAVQLVIQAGSLGKCGEIFLLDMGDPVKIVDLARNFIELSGLVPDKDVTIEFTGLRPGEKLSEELLASGERGVRSTKYSKIFVVEALDPGGTPLDSAVKDLEDAAMHGDQSNIYALIRSLNIGYDSPNDHRGRHRAVEVHLQIESIGTAGEDGRAHDEICPEAV